MGGCGVGLGGTLTNSESLLSSVVGHMFFEKNDGGGEDQDGIKGPEPISCGEM